MSWRACRIMNVQHKGVTASGCSAKVMCGQELNIVAVFCRLLLCSGGCSMLPVLLLPGAGYIRCCYCCLLLLPAAAWGRCCCCPPAIPEYREGPDSKWYPSRVQA
jgi:hypothetical protein